MTKTNVALIRCPDYEPDRVATAIHRQFELLGGLKQFVRPGDKVLLKPNFIAPRSPEQSATQTHPVVILEMAKLLKDYGARPIVGDSPAWSDTKTCAGKLGLIEPLATLGVPLVDLNKSRKESLGPKKPRVYLSSVALDADAIINMPKFKGHQQLTMTFAIKNMYGCVCGKRKALWHFQKGDDETEFCTFLIDIYRRLAPVVTFIDGIVAMEGSGPIRGPSKSLGWLIAGTDPMACETVCCQLIDLAPERVPIIRTAKKIGFGCADIEQIGIVGDALPAEPCRDFQMPELVPIKFSLPHVCRSVIRQIMFLMRAVRDG